MTARARIPDPDALTAETLLRLAVACAVEFPDRSMTVHGLRKEHRAGRLDIWRLAGKDYTTIAALRAMRIKCLLPAKAPASTCAAPDETTTAASAPPTGSSATEASSTALAAARTILQGLRAPSSAISARPASPRRRPRASVLRLIS